MPGLPKQTKRRDLIRRFRELGWEGPRGGTGHGEFMWKGKQKVQIPNPHKGDIGLDLLRKILWQAGISDDVWTGEIHEADADGAGAVHGHGVREDEEPTPDLAP